MTRENETWARMFLKGWMILVAIWGAAFLFVFINIAGAILAGILTASVTAERGFVPTAEADESSFELFLEWFEREHPATEYRIESGESEEYPACGPGSQILIYETNQLGVMSHAPLEAAKELGLWNCWLTFTRAAPAHDAQNGLLFGYVPAFVLIAALVFAARRRPVWRGIFLHWQPVVTPRRVVPVGAVTALGALLIAIAAGYLLAIAGVPLDGPTALVDADNLAWGLPLMVLFAPVVEEYTFRAWLQGRLGYVIGDKAALIVATLLFVVAHLPASGAHALMLLIPGLMFGMLWMKTRSLSACIVAHGLFNLGAVGTWMLTT